MASDPMVEIARALDRAKIPYMFIGGQAVLFYARLRMTQDIDVTLGVAVDRYDDVVAALEPLPSHPVDMGMPPREFARVAMLHPRLHEPTGMRIDVAFSYFEFERQAIARARTFEVEGYPIRVASPEDLIVLKTIPGRPRDVDDIEAIYLRNRGHLDLAHIRRWLDSYTEMLAEPVRQRFEDLIVDIERRRKR